MIKYTENNDFDVGNAEKETIRDDIICARMTVSMETVPAVK